MSLKMKVRAIFTGYALTSTLVGNVDYRPAWFVQFALGCKQFESQGRASIMK